MIWLDVAKGLKSAVMSAQHCGVSPSKLDKCKYMTWPTPDEECVWSHTTVISKYRNMYNARTELTAASRHTQCYMCCTLVQQTMCSAGQKVVYTDSWKYKDRVCMNRLCMDSWKHNCDIELGRSNTLTQHMMHSAEQMAAAAQTGENSLMTVDLHMLVRSIVHMS